MARRFRTHTADDIEARLAKKFAAPSYAFMPQLYQETGAGATSGRRADAVAMSLWPSRGLHLIGFEIKVDRADLLRELRTPAKADAIQRFCHQWWLVTSPDLVSDMELMVMPQTWGRMEAHGAADLKVVKQAPTIQPEPLTIEIVASLFRGFANTIPYLSSTYVPKAEVETMAEERAKEIIAREPIARQYEQLRKHVAEFEEASGVSLAEPWRNSGAKIGEAVKAIIENSYNGRSAQRVEHELNLFRRHVKDLETLHAALQSVGDLNPCQT
jgi:hypothetical protein